MLSKAYINDESENQRSHNDKIITTKKEKVIYILIITSLDRYICFRPHLYVCLYMCMHVCVFACILCLQWRNFGISVGGQVYQKIAILMYWSINLPLSFSCYNHSDRRKIVHKLFDFPSFGWKVTWLQTKNWCENLWD